MRKGWEKVINWVIGRDRRPQLMTDQELKRWVQERHKETLARLALIEDQLLVAIGKGDEQP